MLSTRSLLLSALLLHAAGTADSLTITRGMTGAWYDPSTPGQGLFVEVIDTNQRKEVVVAWFTFGADGNPHWMVGSGLPTDDRVVLDLVERGSGTFAAIGNGEPPLRSWGQAELRFSSCDSAQLSYASALPGFGSGQIGLTRLTNLAGASCSGTPLDDVRVDANVQQAFGLLTSPIAGGPGRGELKLESRAGRVEFEVEVTDLPPGAYQVHVAGVARGVLNVVVSGSATRGQYEAVTPRDDSKPLLDYEVRDQRVEVRTGTTVWLAGQLGASAAVPSPSPALGLGAPPFGNATTVLRLTPMQGGEASAELKQEPDRVKFEVEAKDVAAGPLRLSIDGQARAQFEVSAVAGRLRGEVEFQTPVDDGKLPLDFDPRGKTLELSRDGAVLFRGVLPASPNEFPGTPGTPGTPGGSPLEFEQFMTNTGVDGDARARIRYERRVDRTRFDVELEDLADGSYTLIVGGTTRGQIQVLAGEGEIEFRNPVEPGTVQLDFDPLGQPVSVERGGQVYFVATVRSE